MLLVGLLVWALPCLGAQPASIGLLTDRINAATAAPQPSDPKTVRDFLDISNRGDYIDVMIKELFLLVDLPDELLKRYLDAFSMETGRFSDLDYANNDRSGWQPSYHAIRLYMLARTYAHAPSERLREVILRGIDYWNTAGHVCPNWWYNQIGVPRLMGPVYLVMKPEMSPEQLAGAVRIMDRSQIGMTGQNKVALSGCALIRGLLTDDLALVRAARDSIASEIYVTTGEGLQPDASFHQHGPMMQFGNYGLAYIGAMAYWGGVFAGTDWAFDSAQTDLLARYALEGIRWTVWRGAMDIAACGRQIFTRSPEGKAYALAQATTHMAVLDPDRAEEYTNDTFTGNKFFPRSDYLIRRSPNWYSSVRMSSDHTYGFEMTNSENLLGTYSADGVTHTAVDGDEYYEIFPVWDWRRLPGLTVQDNGRELSTRYNYYSNLSDFVGAAAARTAAAAAMRLDRDGLKARKAYFYIDDMVVCLGADIRSDSLLPTSTAVEQSLLKGEVRYGIGNKTYTLTQGAVEKSDLTWAHQNKVGYLFLEPMDVRLSAEQQTGSWSRIAHFYRGWPTEQRDVFSVTIAHRLPSSYAYALLPDRTAEATERTAKNIPVRVVENSATVQAVASSDGQLLVVAYAPCTVAVKGIYFSAQTPGIYLVERSTKGAFRVAAADPTQKLTCLRYALGTSARTAVAQQLTIPQDGSTQFAQ